MITLYGIANCDTMKKARKWLDENNLEYTFHDYKKKGIDQATLERWAKEAGLDTLVNTRGTTWRKLPEAEKTDLTPVKTIELLINHTSMIKRPVLELNDQILVGFKAELYASTLLK
ncbi:MAG: ArsC family reductase [Pseudomonadales bacterium]|nr:ArsC family reductase [Pseudomonadales bacterium]